MSEVQHDSWDGEIVHTTLAESDAKALREDRQICALTVTIGNVDLPAFVSGGSLYIQAPLPHVFKAFAEDVSEFVRDLEVRVSDARGGSFSLDSDGRPVPGTRMAKSRVVRDRRLS